MFAPVRMLIVVFLTTLLLVSGRAASLLDFSFKPDPAFQMDIQAVAVQRDGRIFAGGVITKPGNAGQPKYLAVAKLLATGALDTSFAGGTGILELGIPVESNDERVADIKILTNGATLVVMHRHVPSPEDPRVRQNLSASTIALVTPDGSGFSAWAKPPAFVKLAPRSDGKFFVWGSQNWSIYGNEPYVRLLDADGNEDGTFHYPPGLRRDFGSTIIDLTVTQDRGVIVAVALVKEVVARLSLNGDIRWQYDGAAAVQRVFEDEDGRTTILPATFRQGIPVTRLEIDGSVSNMDFHTPVIDYWTENHRLHDGRFLIFGDFGQVGGIRRMNVACLMPDGSLDLQFDPGAGFGSWRAPVVVAEQPDGGILIASRLREFDGQPVGNLFRIFPRNPDADKDLTKFYGMPEDLYVYECGSRTHYTIARAGNLRETNTVTLKTRPSSALSGVDFLPLDTNIVFMPGQRFAEVELPAVADDEPEDTEQFYLEVRSDGPELTTRGDMTVRLFDIKCSLSFTTNRLVLSESDARSVNSVARTEVRFAVTGGVGFRIRFEERTAREGRDYMSRRQWDGSLLLAPLDNAVADGDRVFRLELEPLGPGVRLPEPSSMDVVIHDDDSPAGAARGFGGVPPASPGNIPTLWSVLPCQDGRWLAVGAFNRADGLERNGLALLKPDGLVDPAFTPPAENLMRVTCAAVQPDGKILVGGEFDPSWAPVRVGVIRLMASGQLDPDFYLPAPFEVRTAYERPAAIMTVDGGKLVVQWRGEEQEVTTRSLSGGALMEAWRHPASFKGLFFIPEPAGSFLVVAGSGIFRLHTGGLVRSIVQNRSYLGPFDRYGVSSLTAPGSTNRTTWIAIQPGLTLYSEDGEPLQVINDVVFEGRTYPRFRATGLLAMDGNRMFAIGRSGSDLLSIIFDHSGKALGCRRVETDIFTMMWSPVSNASGEIAVMTSPSFGDASNSWLRLDHTGFPIGDIAVNRIATGPDGRPGIALRGQAPRGYRIDYSDDLGSWNSLLERPDINTEQSFVPPDGGTNAPQRFYRVRSR